MTMPIYYAGYDPGSGIGSLQATQLLANGQFGETRTLSIPSLIGNGDLQRLMTDRGTRFNAPLTSVLRKGEIAPSYDNKQYYVGPLAEEEGVNTTSAKGALKRYTDLHSRLLFLALFASLVPDRNCEVRLVTGLPISLFEPETRKLVKQTLQGEHPFTFNGVERNVNVVVGTVTREGAKTLATYGLETDEQGFIDIGERTTDIGQAKGQRVISRLCRADTFGVGKVLDHLILTIQRRHRRKLKITEARTILKAYTAKRPLPPVTVGNVTLPDTEIKGILGEAIDSEYNAIETFIEQVWNEEGAEVGSNLKLILCVGGGAHVFGERLKIRFPQLSIPDQTDESAVLANVEAYHNLAVDLEEIEAGIWNAA